MNQTEQSMIFGYLASAILVRPSDHVCPTPYLLGTFLGAKIGARLPPTLPHNCQHVDLVLTLTADRTAFWAHSEFGNALEVPGPALEPAFLQVTADATLITLSPLRLLRS